MHQPPRRCAPLTLRVADVVQLRGTAHIQRRVDHCHEVVFNHLIKAASSTNVLHTSFTFENIRETPKFGRMNAERCVID